MLFDIHSYCVFEQESAFEDCSFPIQLKCYDNASELLKVQLLGSLAGEDTGFFAKVLPNFPITALISKYKEDITLNGPVNFFHFIGKENLQDLEKKVTERFYASLGSTLRFKDVTDLTEFLVDADVKYIAQNVRLPQWSLDVDATRFANTKTNVAMILLGEYPVVKDQTEADKYSRALKIIFQDRFTSNVKHKFVVTSVSEKLGLDVETLNDCVNYYLVGNSKLLELSDGFMSAFTRVQQKLWEVSYANAY